MRGIVADATRYHARLRRDQRVLAGTSAAVESRHSWPPLAPFRGLLLTTWHGLSDVKLAEALDDHAERFLLIKPVPRLWRSCRWRSA